MTASLNTAQCIQLRLFGKPDGFMWSLPKGMAALGMRCTDPMLLGFGHTGLVVRNRSVLFRLKPTLEPIARSWLNIPSEILRGDRVNVENLLCVLAQNQRLGESDANAVSRAELSYMQSCLGGSGSWSSGITTSGR